MSSREATSGHDSSDGYNFIIFHTTLGGNWSGCAYKLITDLRKNRSPPINRYLSRKPQARAVALPRPTASVSGVITSAKPLRSMLYRNAG